MNGRVDDENVNPFDEGVSDCKETSNLQKRNGDPFIKYNIQTQDESEEIKKLVIPINIVIVGDSQCGKTSMIKLFMQDFIQIDPTLSTYIKSMQIDNAVVEFTLWDVPGESMYDRFRPLAYATANGIICCFDVGAIDALNSVHERWIPELEMYCENCPVVLVGLKRRVSRLDTPFDVCKEFATERGMNYYEIESLTDRSEVERVFRELSLLVIDKRYQRENALQTMSINSSTNLDSTSRRPISKANSSIQSNFSIRSDLNSSIRSTRSIRSRSNTLRTNNKPNTSRPQTASPKGISTALARTAFNRPVTATSSIRSSITIDTTFRPNPENQPRRITRMDSMTSLRQHKNDRCIIM